MVTFGRLFRKSYGNTRISHKEQQKANKDAEFLKSDLFNRYEDESIATYGGHYRELTSAKKRKIRHKVYGDTNWRNA